MRIVDAGEFADYFDGVRARTRRAIDAIPPEAFDWTPPGGRWSFADLVRHLGALERWMFAENVAGRPSCYPGHGSDLADGRDAVLVYFDRMHAESMAIVRALTPEGLARRCRTPAGIELTTWKWLRAMVEHEVHHRGQIYLMLRLLGVSSPPLYGLTSEQVRERSIDEPTAEMS